MKKRFKIMHSSDVNRRTNENDLRLFYCDQDIDFIVTTISKKHVEPSHMHKENTESYYVLRGKLIMYVDGEKIQLNKGDMMIVHPGACHSFETTGENVCFYAIKKLPLHKDKKTC